jgi:hypothetical protein
MGNLLGVSVEELVLELKTKNARMPFEIGAFVALETCEALLKGPARVSARDVRITEDGTLSVYVAPASASDADAARAIVDLLTYLLVAAGHGVPPVFLEIVEVSPADRGWDLARLREELEASLVPLNRQASRRVLARLIREASREGSIHHGPDDDPAPDAGAVDAELDALLGGDIDAPPSEGASATTSGPTTSSGPTTTSGPTTSSGMVAAPPGEVARGAGPRQSRPARSDAPPASEPRMPTPAFGLEAPAPSPVERPMVASSAGGASAPPLAAVIDAVSARESSAPRPREVASERPGPRPVDASDFDDAPSSSGGLRWLAVFGVLIVGLLGAVAWMRPDVLARLMGRAPEEPPASSKAAAAVPEPTAPSPYGTLRVRVTPDDAQVLLLVGEGPALAEKLPMGVAHEFIAIADGRAPSRAVVPHTAEWTKTDPPTYELAMQASDTPMAAERLDLGKTKLVGADMGSPSGGLGNVRVITNPPRARVYLLIGFSPYVEVENLRTDRAYELLVFAPKHAPRTVAVPPGGWTDLDGKRAQELSVTLEASR